MLLYGSCNMCKMASTYMNFSPDPDLEILLDVNLNFPDVWNAVYRKSFQRMGTVDMKLWWG